MFVVFEPRIRFLQEQIICSSTCRLNIQTCILTTPDHVPFPRGAAGKQTSGVGGQTLNNYLCEAASGAVQRLDCVLQRPFIKHFGINSRLTFLLFHMKQMSWLKNGGRETSYSSNTVSRKRYNSLIFSTKDLVHFLTSELKTAHTLFHAPPLVFPSSQNILQLSPQLVTMRLQLFQTFVSFHH